MHWADGGDTVAENLILLCRFHHGRVHTPGWTVTKTGPGQAVIVHHEGHEAAPGDMTEHDGPGGCGCADWRTDTDLEADFADDASNVFPLGLFPEEHAPSLKEDLDRAAERAETETAWAAVKTARDKVRARFTTEAAGPAPEPDPDPDPGPDPSPDHHHGGEPPFQRELSTEPARTATGPALGPPPFLGRPPREPPRGGGEQTHDAPTRTPPEGLGPPPCPHPAHRPRPPHPPLRRRQGEP